LSLGISGEALVEVPGQDGGTGDKVDHDESKVINKHNFPLATNEILLG
jgi:hypothetical protein